MTVDTHADHVGSTGIREVLPDAPEASLEIAAEIAANSGRRTDTPVRVGFVRDSDKRGNAPLARLIDTGGRGGAVAIKLYLALLWRSSAPPFDTSIPARKWAELLGLNDPAGRGARRVIDALRTLEDQKLVSVESQPGEPSRVFVLDEHGQGARYRLPSQAYQWATKKADDHIYFKVPTTLWTNGHIQSMSAPALAMLLIILSSDREAGEGKKVWWSTKLFPEQYGLSPATRARGTRELIARRLLLVTKQLVNDQPGTNRTFTRERVRNVYQLINDATFPKRQQEKVKPSAPSVPVLRRKRVKPKPIPAGRKKA